MFNFNNAFYAKQERSQGQRMTLLLQRVKASINHRSFGRCIIVDAASFEGATVVTSEGSSPFLVRNFHVLRELGWDIEHEPTAGHGAWKRHRSTAQVGPAGAHKHTQPVRHTIQATHFQLVCRTLNTNADELAFALISQTRNVIVRNIHIEVKTCREYTHKHRHCLTSRVRCVTPGA